MKRFSLIILSVLLIFCFCSCKSNYPHRKIVLSDGTEICFAGDCGIHDTFINFQVKKGLLNKYSYVSIDGRSFQIIECSCDSFEVSK